MSKPDPRRALPSVDAVLRALDSSPLPRPALAALIRRELASLRSARGPIDSEQALQQIRVAAADLARARIRTVINGTGILVHTNFGRAPLAAEAVRQVQDIAAGYCNLEYDLATGQRGARAAYLEHNLAVLCGAPAATVVNNCAAALVLILRHLTRGDKKQVVISRGELLQIGGGFRIPEILEASGAVLREVGTTNKTTVSDYARAIGKQTALLLKVHHSNFYMDGFTEFPATRDLAVLARKHRIPFVEDLGSGAVHNTEQVPGVEHEPTPSEVLASGVDLVCFSADKLLGGPQAGIIAGKAKLVAALKRDPFFRTLRCDKLVLTALQATVDLHLTEPQSIPIVSMMRESIETLKSRADEIVAGLADLPLAVQVGIGKSKVGGGTLPRSVIPSVTLDLIPRNQSLEDFAHALRSATPPVVGYIAAKRFKIDLRTVFPQQDAQLLDAIRSAKGFTAQAATSRRKAP